MRPMSQILAETIDKPTLTAFGWGVGYHAEKPLCPAPISAPAIEILRELGVRRYRVNVGWDSMTATGSAVPDCGRIEALGDSVMQLLDAGIEPMIALDNSAVPEELAADGGWRNARAVRAYVDFVGAVGACLGHLVDDWLTLATPWVDNEDRSVAGHLANAHLEALRVLRAHCPFGRIGATVDIRQYDTRLSVSGRSAADRWSSTLADNQLPIDFVALNVDGIGTRSATEIADVIRALAGSTTARAFLLVQVMSAADQHAGDEHPSASETEEMASIVAPAIEQMITLRSEGIAMAGAFTWPFEPAAEGNSLRFTDSLSAKHRHFAAAAMN